MKSEEFRDFKLIMEVLNRYSREERDNTLSLSNMEDRVLSKIEIVNLKKEIMALKKLEYILIFAIFIFLLFLSPGQIGQWIKGYPYNSNLKALSAQGIEDVVDKAEISLENYLETEMDLNSLFISENVLSDEYKRRCFK